jgi:hypothetical protein
LPRGVSVRPRPEHWYPIQSGSWPRQSFFPALNAPDREHFVLPKHFVNSHVEMTILTFNRVDFKLFQKTCIKTV